MTTDETQFLEGMLRNKTSVNVFLITGIKLTGRIHKFDAETIQLEGKGAIQMIYRHGVVTVSPATGLQAAS